MKWADGPMVGFDVETTGTNAWADRIATAAVVELYPARRPVSYTWVVNPGIPMPAEASEVNGITDEFLAKHGKAPATAVFEISARLALAMGKGFPIVAFNAAFDLTMLEQENRRHACPTLAERIAPKTVAPIVDPMVLDKHIDPYRPGVCDGNQKRAPRCTCGATDKKLTSLVKHYAVHLDGAHTADGDALAACRLFPRILARSAELHASNPRVPDLTIYPIGQLHQAQIGWRRDQMLSLRRYFDRAGTEHDGCNGGWPLRTDRPVTTTTTQGALL